MNTKKQKQEEWTRGQFEFFPNKLRRRFVVTPTTEITRWSVINHILDVINFVRLEAASQRGTSCRIIYVAGRFVL
jgi:hypothetical protein